MPKKKPLVDCPKCGERKLVLSHSRGVAEGLLSILGNYERLTRVLLKRDRDAIQEDGKFDELAENVQAITCQNCGHSEKQFTDNRFPR